MTEGRPDKFLPPDFDTRVEETRRKLRATRFPGIDTENALLWLALAPAWTPRVAKQAGFPINEPERVFQSLASRHLIETNGILPPDPSPDQVYFLSAYRREEVLAEYLDQPEQRRHLRQLLHRIGAQIRPLLGGIPHPPVLRRWAVLAEQALNGAAMADELEKNVALSMRVTKDRDEDLGEAFHWLEAARFLTQLLARDRDPVMELALEGTRQRLELLHRRRRDKQFLVDYQPRLETDRAFEDLMNCTPVYHNTPPWALHLIGAGGCGKTMFLRHVTSELADRHDFLTARIDFDYLNPDYPTRAPGLLLWSFAEQLRPLTRNRRARSLFDSADGYLRQVHGGSRHEPVTNDPLFRDALRYYIEALQILTAKPARLLILILDTCEELARFQDRRTAHNIAETLRIIQGLRDGPDSLDHLQAPPTPENGLPNLRVIFSGRLLLASKGANYDAPGSPLQEKLFLRLHEIRGFTPNEVENYLKEKAKVPKEYVPAILANSPDLGSVVPMVQWSWAAGPPNNDPRYNPYDIKLFADWVNEKPRPKLKEIACGGRDLYVQMRILSRVNNATLAEALPVLVLLGNFDASLLQAITDSDDITLQEAIERLRQLEWVNQRSASIEGGRVSLTVWSIEPELRKRLLRYYGRTAVASVGRQRAAAYLEKLTLHPRTALASLDWTAFDAGLRALEAEPERAARWWERLEKRLIQERGWPWTGDMLKSLMDKGAAAPRARDGSPGQPAESPLRYLVLTTNADYLGMTDQAAHVFEVWDELAAKALSYPEPRTAANLRLRGLAGRITAAMDAKVSVSPELVKPLWEQLKTTAPQILTLKTAIHLVAALETIVRQAESLARSGLRLTSDVRGLLDFADDEGAPTDRGRSSGAARVLDLLNKATPNWTGEEQTLVVPVLLAFNRLLYAQVLLLLGDEQHALDTLYATLDLARDMKPLTESIQWLWPSLTATEDVAGYVILRCIRILYPAVSSAEDILQHLAAWKPQKVAVQARAAILRVSLAVRAKTSQADLPAALAVQDVYQIAAENSMTGSDSPQTLYDPDEPSNRVVVLELLAAIGMMDTVVGRLRVGITMVNSSDESLHMERLLAQITRRLRLFPEDEVRTLQEAVESGDWALREAMRALCGSGGEIQARTDPARAWSVPRGSPLAWWHSNWQTLSLRDSQNIELTRRWCGAQWKKVAEYLDAEIKLESFLGATVQLDLMEVGLVLGENSIPADLAGLVRLFDPAVWAEQKRREPVSGLTLLLRAMALVRLGRDAVLLDKLAERIGRRRAAEIALDEGDFLLLRLPALAPRLYQQALRWFGQCDDAVGSFVSGIALLMARGPRAGWEEAGQQLEIVRAAYEKMKMPAWPNTADPVDQLPSWPELEENCASPSVFDRRISPAWRPLLARLLTVLNRWRSSAESSTLRNWLMRTCGLRINGQARLPVDFEGWVSSAPAPLDDIPARGVIRLLPSSGPQFSLSSGSPVSVLAQLYSPGRDTLLQTTEATSGGMLPYESTAATFPLLSAQVPAWFAGVSGKIDLVLDGAEGLHGPCWEAFFSLALARVGAPACRFRRVADGRLSRRPAPAPVCRIASVTGASLEISVAETGWSRFRNAPGFQWLHTAPTELNLPSLEFGSIQEIRVLHLLGVPALSRQGSIFHISPAESNLSSKSASEVHPVAAPFLARQFAELSLCILQVAPQYEMTNRTDTDRNDLFLMREFAADLFRLGIPAVLTIPRLSIPTATSVLRILADNLAAGETTEILLTAVERMQFEISTQIMPLAEARYDLCLYADANRSH